MSAFQVLSSLFKRGNEKNPNSIFNTNNIYYANNARTLLRILLSSVSGSSLKIGVQAYTCHTVFQAIRNAGHQIVFIDIDKDFGLDLKDLKKKINTIDVLIITHTFGYPDDMSKIREIAGNMLIIEDCAHAYLSLYNGKAVGTFGDAAIFSFGDAKFPPIGNLGMAIIKNQIKFPGFNKYYNALGQESILAKIMNLIKKFFLPMFFNKNLYGLITFPIKRKLGEKFDFSNKFSFHESKGFNINKLIFLRNYKSFVNDLETQKKNYNSLKTQIKSSSTVNDGKVTLPNHYAFPFLLNNRDYIFELFIKNRIEPGKHFHKSLEWAAQFGYSEGECPNAEEITNKIITIPIHPKINKKDILKMGNLILKYAKY